MQTKHALLLMIALLGRTLTTAQGPTFEVASVKSNTSASLRASMPPPVGGRFTATNMPLRNIIRFAYGLFEYQIVNEPAWVNVERYDIVAKADGNPPAEQLRLMVRALLAERFKLQAHSETRELPLFVLTVARRDGKLGPQLRRSDATCGDDAGIPFAGPPDGRRSCGFIGPGANAPISSGRSNIAMRGVTIRTLASFLGPMVRRAVIDRSGLDGYFDADFDWTQELPPPPPPPGVPDPYNRETFPTIFTVLREQLGLKLDAQRAPVDVLVIDHVERPSAS